MSAWGKSWAYAWGAAWGQVTVLLKKPVFWLAPFDIIDVHVVAVVSTTARTTQGMKRARLAFAGNLELHSFAAARTCISTRDSPDSLRLVPVGTKRAGIVLLP